VDKTYYLIIGSKEYKISSSENSALEQMVTAKFPVIGESNTIKGEIYFLTTIDIPFDGSQREVFEIGDIVYWRSPNENIFAIAIFYGNTEHGDGNSPTAASPCIKLGTVDRDCADLAQVKPGDKITLVCR